MGIRTRSCREGNCTSVTVVTSVCWEHQVTTVDDSSSSSGMGGVPITGDLEASMHPVGTINYRVPGASNKPQVLLL